MDSSILFIKPCLLSATEEVECSLLDFCSVVIRFYTHKDIPEES